MNKILSMVKNELKINDKHPLILSVSGGVDSMSLLTLMLDSPYKLVVVHFNHLKRDESVIEKDLVESFCQKHEIPFHYYAIDIQSGNFHHQAHQMRLHYLKEVAHLYKTPYILTAHQLDDLFENILIKLTRGSNLLGYSGMQLIYSDHSYTYIKPLLYTPKQELLDYAKLNNITYLDDESNEENFYLRNRYRHAIVPIMKQENDQLLEQIKQYHEQLSNAFHFIRKTTKSHINKDMVLSLEQYKTFDLALQDDIIAYLIESHDLSLSYEIITKIKKMLLSKKPNQTYKLSKNFIFVKAYDQAYIKPLIPIKAIRIKVKEGETKLLNMAIFTFSHKTDSNTADFSKLCYNKLAFPLWLRHRVDGDLLSFDYGHKKLKKLLIDEKVPDEERQNLWILTDNENTILWVQKYYMNQTLGNEQNLYFDYKEVHEK